MLLFKAIRQVKVAQNTVLLRINARTLIVFLPGISLRICGNSRINFIDGKKLSSLETQEMPKSMKFYNIISLLGSRLSYNYRPNPALIRSNTVGYLWLLQIKSLKVSKLANRAEPLQIGGGWGQRTPGYTPFTNYNFICKIPSTVKLIADKHTYLTFSCDNEY